MQLTDAGKARLTTVLAVGVTLVAAAFIPVLPSQALSGADFYATIDLDRPELAAVKAEVDQGDYSGADEELPDFYAGRQMMPVRAAPDVPLTPW